ncbi:MAG: methylated-DNA--[protein]-cysteine S-methyltransferase [Bacilli bacterium]|nr:methylated-DNA--[protein]-cysteine S-methyltransferase [Bacilli bacterium]MDD4282739.1 methylated-DNA--[protein]-cysteine S-methyltransferase [Bacilli bacterium]MDD4718996.1 methylated-DNA--[protein]-cysteine S-methyltransferase [Bacilli bacterium]
MKYIFFYETIIGKIGIVATNDCITNIYFENNINNYEILETPLIKKAYKQIDEYLKGIRKTFDIPIDYSGTEFQKRVWKALLNIPYGETKTYKEIANMIGAPIAYRAVGNANNKNPVPIIIPCHRVIGTNGKLVGYAGGLNIKEKLINLELNTIKK